MRPAALVTILVVLSALAFLPSLFDIQGLSIWIKATVLAVVLSLAVIAYRWQVYGPFVRVRDKQVAILTEIVLNSLHIAYRERHPGSYDLRINVMRVSRRYRWLGDKHLRVTFWHGDYDPAKLDLIYHEGAGCCGTALAQNGEAFFDRTSDHETRKDLPAIHRRITEHVESIVSIPIYRPGDDNRNDPIGILNLDSRSPITDTMFRNDELRAIVAQYAGILGGFVP